MKIISFSNASSEPFLTTPIQLLTSWFSRLKTAQARFAASFASGLAIEAKQKLPLREPESIDQPVASHEAAPCDTLPRSGLRVVRESDSAVSPDCAGRMVISGRMAEVCAELERMALRSTAAHQHRT